MNIQYTCSHALITWLPVHTISVRTDYQSHLILILDIALGKASEPHLQSVIVIKAAKSELVFIVDIQCIARMVHMSPLFMAPDTALCCASSSYCTGQPHASIHPSHAAMQPFMY